MISQRRVELREVSFKNKPAEMIEASAKGTVPVLVQANGAVIDESLDIMLWTLENNDPDDWLKGNIAEMLSLIDRCEDDFKGHLDRYKYANRYEGADPIEHREKACEFLSELEAYLEKNTFLFGKRAKLADMAIVPFVRQFANTDREWFDQCQFPHVREWTVRFMESTIFQLVMKKYPLWDKKNDEIIIFER